MKQGPVPQPKYPVEKPMLLYSPFQVVHHDVIGMIFSMLPKQHFLPQRLLSKRCQRIIDLQRLNNPAAQDMIQHTIQNEADQNALFASQQREIDCLLANKKAILNTPKFETQVVRPDDELLKSFKELENIPADVSLFSLYRRHVALNNINLHMVLNTRNLNQLYDMYVFNKVVDLSGLHLTRLPPMLFNNPNLVYFPFVLNVSNNCLTQLPCSILRLKKLKILDLSGNSIVKLPENINDFEHLETVFLANNSLQELPLGLIRLKKLKHLDIRRNCLQVLPPELDTVVLSRFRYTSVPLSRALASSALNYAQYLKQLPVLCKISRPQVLATQKPQNESSMFFLTNAFRSLTIKPR